MKADGYSLDDKRNPLEENDIPDLIARFHSLESEKREKTYRTIFFVPVQEIVENGYELSINRYKEIEYEEVHYENQTSSLTTLRS